MDIETIRRVCLARYLFELGSSNLRSTNDFHLFAAVNLVQDALEAFLVAVADHLNIAVDQTTKFDKYFVLIDEKIAPASLPFKNKLLRLNRVRVDAKHHGIQPARDEVERLTVTAREFLDEVSATQLGQDFATVSTLDLLRDDAPSKGYLAAARAFLEAKDYEACLVNCRKAVFLEIERDFDVSMFAEEEPRGLLAMFSSAPFYAKNRDYIARNVREPTDYVVLDHQAVDRLLLTYGVSPNDFWNVWRLTPRVYQKRGEGNSWYVRREFDKLLAENAKSSAEYVLQATMDVVLSIHQGRKAQRWHSSKKFEIELARKGVVIYAKADRTSEVLGTFPDETSLIETDYEVEGLRNDGRYWHVYLTPSLISGFICDADVKPSE